MGQELKRKLVRLQNQRESQIESEGIYDTMSETTSDTQRSTPGGMQHSGRARERRQRTNTSESRVEGEDTYEIGTDDHENEETYLSGSEDDDHENEGTHSSGVEGDYI